MQRSGEEELQKASEMSREAGILGEIATKLVVWGGLRWFGKSEAWVFLGMGKAGAKALTWALLGEGLGHLLWEVSPAH